MTAPPVLNPGQPFTKGWRIQNSGTCDWQIGYALTYVSGNVPAAQMGGQPIPVTRVVKPGETFDFNANLTAPICARHLSRLLADAEPGEAAFRRDGLGGHHRARRAHAHPAPTQTPVPGIIFTANPTTITAGQSVLFQWSTSNVQAVYFYHDGQDWQNHGVAGVGQSTEYPPQTMNYYLRVVLPNNEVQVRTITISVNPAAGAPVIDSFSASPASILVSQCVNVQLVGERPGQSSHAAYQQQAGVGLCASVRQLSRLPHRDRTRGSIRCRRSVPAALLRSKRRSTCKAILSRLRPTATPSVPVPQPPVINGFTLAPDSIALGRLHDRLLDHWRRHYARAVAARQCDHLGQCAAEQLGAGLPADPGRSAAAVRHGVHVVCL